MEEGSGSIGAQDDSVGAGLFQPRFSSIVTSCEGKLGRDFGVVSGLVGVNTIDSGDQATGLTGRQAEDAISNSRDDFVDAVDLAANENHVTVDIGTVNVTLRSCVVDLKSRLVRISSIDCSQSQPALG
jgi:hypothetical protein